MLARRWIIGLGLCLGIIPVFPASAFDQLSCETGCLSLPDYGPRDECKRECRARATKEATCKRGRGCNACLESVGDRATVEVCDEGRKIYYADCFCRKPDGSSYNYDNISTWTIEKCTVNCKLAGGSVDTTQGIGKFAPAVPAAGSSQASGVNALCFTQDQCSAPEYGGSIERFLPGQGCPQGQGKCLAPEPKLELSSPILGQKAVTGIRSYIFLAFQYLLNIVLIVTVIRFVYAGFKYIFGSSFGDIQSAKDTMVNATIGLILTFGAVLLLRTVNPATTRFDTLKVYLINKQEFTLATWCNTIQPQGGKERMFADAGKPPGSIPFSAAANFSVSGQATKCGSTYYVQGTTGQTCGGLSCADTKGTSCLKCVSTTMSSECARVPLGDNVCMKLTFGGTIEWKHAKWPQYLWLLPVCEGIQPPENFAKIDNNVKNRIVAKITKTEEAESGAGSYSFALSDAQLGDWEAQCGGKGLLGVLLAGLYKDAMSKERAAENLKTVKSFYQGLKTGAVAGGTSGVIGGAVAGPTGSIGAGVLGAITGGIAGGVATQYSPDDIFVAARWNCLPKNVGKAMYAGYADGEFGRDLPDIKKAIYCGWSVKPLDTSIREEYLAKHDTGVFDVWGDEDRKAYWTVDELKAAIDGSKPISCPLVFNAILTPTDPGTNVMGCCQSTSLYKDAKPNTLWCSA